MLDTHSKSPITRHRLRSGPAAEHIDEFADWLDSKGYTPTCIEYRLQALARWTDWMNAARLSSEAWLRAFEDYKSVPLKPPRPVRCSIGATKDSITAAGCFIRFLLEMGYLPEQTPPPSSSDRWPIIGEFRKWMLEQRGVTESTLDTYEQNLWRLLNMLGDDTRKYSAKTLRAFVAERTANFSIHHAKAVCGATRSFCRFLSATGRCCPGLEYGIPGFPSRQYSSVPRFINADEVERLIDSCDTYRFGVRDKAILLLLSRLGLRASDVVNLRFDDIDWSSGTITVSGKSRRQELLPLTQEIGDAILVYLHQSRPPLQITQVFTSVLAPYRRLQRGAIKGIVRAALDRAGIKAPTKGAHLLRHSAATAMLRNGAPLASIGAVLRHRSYLSMTAHYAKVDFDALSEIAQPWPEVPLC